MNTRERNGFSLIEVIVSLSIIAIMIVTVTPLILFSINSIKDSGSKSGSLYTAKGTVDVGIVEKDASKYTQIPVKFSGSLGIARTVGGGLVQKDDIRTFLADAPTISISPVNLNEGYAGTIGDITNRTINIVGNNTHFSAASKVLVTPKGGTSITCTPFNILPNSAAFKLPIGFKNINSPLSIKISTKVYYGIEDIKDEVVRCELPINLPEYIAVGNSGINLISDFSDLADNIVDNYWTVKDSGTSQNINSIAYGNNQYISAGSSGGLYRLIDGNNWSILSTGLASNINAIRFFNNTFTAVGNNGLIISSTDGTSWTTATSTAAVNLNGVAYNGDLYVAVGENGTILKSGDRMIWENPNIDINIGTVGLNDVISYSDKFIAVGNNGIIVTSTDGNSWSRISQVLTSPGNLRKVTCNADKTLLAAISSTGKVFTSANGIAWTARTSGVTVELNDIIFTENKYMAVGDAGTILTSVNGTTWTKITGVPATSRLAGVSSK